jgi:hypothetical protein
VMALLALPPPGSSVRDVRGGCLAVGYDTKANAQAEKVLWDLYRRKVVGSAWSSGRMSRW